MSRWQRVAALCLPLLFLHTAMATEGAKIITYYGYDDCILLEQGPVKVVLCPAAGGRVLEFSHQGVNGLFLPPGDEGWTESSGKQGGSMNAGRFDIGPELTIKSHPLLWRGKWTGEITGKTSARLTSQKDTATGVQLVRDFVLDPETLALACKQTIKNVSEEPVEYCHWSRTFAIGGGICLIPLTEPSRFPNNYVMYEEGGLINAKPEDPKIRVRDGYLEILAAPRKPKLGMDSMAGWFAYLMPNDLMFVKRFETYPERPYNEVAGLTISIWYPHGPMCELEPIGPREKILPGQSASFTETWSLIPFPFPKAGQAADLRKVEAKVKSQADLK